MLDPRILLPLFLGILIFPIPGFADCSGQTRCCAVTCKKSTCTYKYCTAPVDGACPAEGDECTISIPGTYCDGKKGTVQKESKSQCSSTALFDSITPDTMIDLITSDTGIQDELWQPESTPVVSPTP